MSFGAPPSRAPDSQPSGPKNTASPSPPPGGPHGIPVLQDKWSSIWPAQNNRLPASKTQTVMRSRTAGCPPATTFLDYPLPLSPIGGRVFGRRRSPERAHESTTRTTDKTSSRHSCVPGTGPNDLLGRNGSRFPRPPALSRKRNAMAQRRIFGATGNTRNKIRRTGSLEPLAL